MAHTNKRPYEAFRGSAYIEHRDRKKPKGNYKSINSHNLNPSTKSLPSDLPPLPPITPELSTKVFTHASAIQGEAKVSCVNANYERLEILGDVYIELAATKAIYTRFPTYTAGQISQHRETLVRNETLKHFAQGYGFDKLLNIGQATREMARTNPKDWAKIMGDVFEAYVGAVVQSDKEQGHAVVEEWLLAVWGDLLSRPDDAKGYDPMAKRDLATKVVSKGVKLEYEETEPQNMQREVGKTVFSVGVFLTGWGYEKRVLGRGKGLSLKEAGQRAASDALGNHLTDDLKGAKKVFDEKVKQEREAAEGSRMERNVQGDRG